MCCILWEPVRELARAKLRSWALSSAGSAWGFHRSAAAMKALRLLSNQILSRVPPLLGEMACLQATRGQIDLLIYEMLYHGIRRKNKLKQSDSARQLKSQCIASKLSTKLIASCCSKRKKFLFCSLLWYEIDISNSAETTKSLLTLPSPKMHFKHMPSYW